MEIMIWVEKVLATAVANDNVARLCVRVNYGEKTGRAWSHTSYPISNESALNMIEELRGAVRGAKND